MAPLPPHLAAADALQYGYTVVIAFTFGESDLYRSLSLMRPVNLFLVKRFGFVLPVFAGWPFLPLLPRTDVELHTVSVSFARDRAPYVGRSSLLALSHTHYLSPSHTHSAGPSQRDHLGAARR